MNIIRKPLITEKFTSLGERLNQYGFIVDKKATKPEIKAEIEKLYDVKVTDIRTMIYAGKTKQKYTKRNIISGRRRDFKKAIVALKEGQEIDFYSEV
ncbi:MAG: 50S ribosomal protein L23 [Bacteroidia bacterium]